MYRILEAPADWEPARLGDRARRQSRQLLGVGKAYAEMRELGLVKKTPRLAIINASGANTLNVLVNERGMKWDAGKYDASIMQKHYAALDESNYYPHTVASAIEISRPVNLPKALRALLDMNGVVREVTDEEILEHRAMVARWGFGCEPASAASVAGLRKLLDEGVIGKDESVVCILTGHELKDPNATVQYHTGIDMEGRAGSRAKERAHRQARESARFRSKTALKRS